MNESLSFDHFHLGQSQKAPMILDIDKLFVDFAGLFAVSLIIRFQYANNNNNNMENSISS